MNDPTLASIPGILARTILRTIARGILILATATLLLTVALLMASLLLGTFRSSRSQYRQLTADILLTVTQIIKNHHQTH